MRRFVPLLFVTLVGAAGSLSAQSASAIAKAAQTITPADLARHIAVMADDSMLGRWTPSAGLEATARYVADQFRRAGLAPGGDHGTWMQRYPMPASMRWLDLARARVVFAAGGKEAVAGFASAAYLDRADRLSLGQAPAGAGVVLVAGQHTLTSIGAKQDRLRDNVVLYVPPAGGISRDRTQALDQLLATSKRLIVLDPDRSPALFAAKRRQAALAGGFIEAGDSLDVSVHVWAPAVQTVLTAGGLDLAQARAATAPVVLELPRLAVRFELPATAATAPNTIGLLEGTDPMLKHEYVVFLAHMDHLGFTTQYGDTIYNGADDNASGTAGLIALARAFGQPGARPRRSLIFLAVSGTENTWFNRDWPWGSDYFVSHSPVPVEQIVASVGLHMIGRNWPDKIAAIGRESSSLDTTLQRAAAAHPELRMTLLEDRWPNLKLFRMSDQYPFAHRKIPSLFFFSGFHEDYHTVYDSPDQIDAEKTSRVVRLAFYLGQAVGDAVDRPAWHTASDQTPMDEPKEPQP